MALLPSFQISTFLLVGANGGSCLNKFVDMVLSISYLRASAILEGINISNIMFNRLRYLSNIIFGSNGKAKKKRLNDDNSLMPKNKTYPSKNIAGNRTFS